MMNNSDVYIEALVAGFFSGNLDERETGELLAWVKESKKHEVLFKKRMRELYALQVAGEWNTIDTGIARNKVFRKLHRTRKLWRMWGTAAAVVVLLFLSVVLYWRERAGDVFVQEKVFSELVQRQGRRQAILSIGTEKKVILNATVKKAILTDSCSHIFMDDSCMMRYERMRAHDAHEVRVHTLEVPQGSEFRLTLSDGTRVWMNAGSKLCYPEYFDGEKREVILAGEAYFEVEHDAEVPFIVKTADMDITVLGTSFDVKAYPEDEYVITTLATGKIKQKYVASGEEIVLSPSEQAVYMKSNGLLKTERVDVGEAIGWKNGRVVMKNKPLKEIFKELARWYDFEVEYKNDRLQDTRFYLNMDRYDDIKMVLEKLQKTNGVKFIFYGRKIFVYDDTILK
ncbi:FecR domain-containing protein [Butyricimonas sp.]|uniref:FecR family protein n=2 Tax=unclassified Butyricimonas TaxID=2637652 RepID=UPI000C082776|nr:FecR domain-containing protein [Butyricimonas sp.]